MRAVVGVVVAGWLVMAAPFIAVGPDDLEEFFSGVAGTKIAVTALASGSTPFWTPNMALGVPQPFRFHFITHPLAPACLGFDCQRVLRTIASLHVLAGALVTGLIVFRRTANATLAAAAGVTFLGSSSAIQPTYIDDWPISAINEASLPLLVYAALALVNAPPRQALVWAIALGGLAGLLVSMSFPLVVVLLMGVVILAEPARVRTHLPYLCLAAAITILIGSGHVYHLFEQVRATVPGVERDDHPDPPLALTLWSTFVRPFMPPEELTWRTVFFGPVFAVSALVSAIASRDRALWPFRAGLLASAAGLVLPEELLFNMVTNRWAYRTGLNFFGIVLGAVGLQMLWRVSRTGRVIAAIALAAHVATIVVAARPVWTTVADAAMSPVHTGDRRLDESGALAYAMQAIHRQRPGRWTFGERAYHAMRQLGLARHGLAPNQLPILGVPVLNIVAYGLTLDPLYPTTAMLIGNTFPAAVAVESREFLNVLGIRYVVAAGDDRVPEGLTRVATLPPNLEVYRNDGAWPEAFFVRGLTNEPVPRLAGCSHDRFLCADFSRYPIDRLELQPITIDRRADRVTLRFMPLDRERYVVVTQWLQPGWRVSSGRARIVPAIERLTGVVIEAGETEVRLAYFPIVRGTLFVAGLLGEGGVIAALAWLVLRRPRVDRR